MVGFPSEEELREEHYNDVGSRKRPPIEMLGQHVLVFNRERTKRVELLIPRLATATP